VTVSKKDEEGEKEGENAQAISSNCDNTTPQHLFPFAFPPASLPNTPSFSSSFLTLSILLFAPSPAYFSSSTNTSFFGLFGFSPSSSQAESTKLPLIGTSSTPAA
jgi:hypothetical protein